MTQEKGEIVIPDFVPKGREAAYGFPEDPWCAMFTCKHEFIIVNDSPATFEFMSVLSWHYVEKDSGFHYPVNTRHCHSMICNHNALFNMTSGSVYLTDTDQTEEWSGLTVYKQALQDAGVKVDETPHVTPEGLRLFSFVCPEDKMLMFLRTSCNFVTGCETTLRPCAKTIMGGEKVDTAVSYGPRAF